METFGSAARRIDLVAVFGGGKQEKAGRVKFSGGAKRCSKVSTSAPPGAFDRRKGTMAGGAISARGPSDWNEGHERAQN
jgi:hypothetical protein